MVENRHNGSGTQNNYNANSQNVSHGRDQINLVFNTSGPNPYKNLWSAIAGVGASHTAEQQYERGECLEGTRVELRRMIHGWGRAGGEGSPLRWLTGAAGVGKTAIAISAAKDFQQEGALVSSFFFFRSDPKRNNPQALWLTIAHGIISTMPFMRRPIEQRISEDPKILEARLEDQFQKLVLDPFLDLVLGPSSRQRYLWTFLLQALCLILSSVMSLDVVWELLVALRLIPNVPPVQIPDIVIIDGLDECSDETTQRRILQTIQSAAQHSPDFPLRFLICSRPESWIKEAFTAEPLCQLTKIISLDDLTANKSDIEQYCRHHFQEIVSDPKYGQVQFPKPWPSPNDLETLVDRSSCQFIYVVTVFKFITLEDNHPVDQLNLVLKSSPNMQAGASSPFHELDALYHTILKAAGLDPEKACNILGAILILPGYLEPTPAHIELLLGLSSGQVSLTLRRMHSVLRIDGRADKIQLYHTSFRDFLVDQNRSQDFYVDLTARRHIVAQHWLQNLAMSKMHAYSFDQLYNEETAYFFGDWMRFCTSIPDPSRELLARLRDVDCSSAFLCRYARRDQIGTADGVSDSEIIADTPLGRDASLTPIADHHDGSGRLDEYTANNRVPNSVKDFNTSGPNPYKNLWSAVAGVGASHTAEQQYARGECLEGTRAELRRMIHGWGRAGGEGSPLCWFAGAPGVGKTAIAISAAKDFQQEGALVSSFFFFRSDPKRNNPQFLWLTIAHGIISTMPFMRRPIEQRISEDPRILEARPEDQFRELILTPVLNHTSGSSWYRCLWIFLLHALYLMLTSVMLLDVVLGLYNPPLPVSLPQVPNIVVIDGLDECGDEYTQLRILNIIRDAVQQSPHFPLRFLICSRPEAWIKEVFDTEHFRRLSKVILVDDALEDIIQYCHHHFQEIVRSPMYKNVAFPNPWPSQEEFGTLVDRSRNQFVFVSTVFRFIRLARNHPVNDLRLILSSFSSNQPGPASPCPELDALYHAILEASSSPEEVHAILVAIFILADHLDPTPAHIELLLGLAPGQVDLTLRGMHSVLHISGRADEISPHHTSFRDYLLDENRSQSFHVDLLASAQEQIVAHNWLEKLTASTAQGYKYAQGFQTYHES
ncbi:hypothetical protein PM082_023279 [Marasmius tenuissimus]|nr:hypothetical protein PM082_023279 [Marasmius tenuissimus]